MAQPSQSTPWLLYESDSTYFIGTQANGAGVFFEDGRWQINVVVKGNIEFFDCPDCGCPADAQKLAIKQLSEHGVYVEETVMPWGGR